MHLMLHCKTNEFGEALFVNGQQDLLSILGEIIHQTKINSKTVAFIEMTKTVHSFHY